MTLTIRNIGVVTIYDAYLRLEANDCLFWRWEPKNEFEMDMDNLETVTRLPSVIHPEMSLTMNIIASSPTPLKRTVLDFKIYARDMLPKKAKMQVSEKTRDRVVKECL